MKKILFLFLLFILVYGCTDKTIKSYSYEQNATILKIIDGDTYLISLNGAEEKVRLLGIDCPDIEKDRMDNFLYLGLSKEKIKYCYEKGKKELEILLLKIDGLMDIIIKLMKKKLKIFSGRQRKGLEG